MRLIDPTKGTTDAPNEKSKIVDTSHVIFRGDKEIRFEGELHITRVFLRIVL